MSGRLPGADLAIVEQKKIDSYLLNTSHPDGGSKAKFFLARGFTLLLWQEFAEALIAQGKENPVTRVGEDRWGVRYRVDCTCRTPDGKNPCIRTIWQVAHGDDTPRLLTAHPRRL